MIQLSFYILLSYSGQKYGQNLLKLIFLLSEIEKGLSEPTIDTEGRCALVKTEMTLVSGEHMAEGKPDMRLNLTPYTFADFGTQR
jgi:hypothetical protein